MKTEGTYCQKLIDAVRPDCCRVYDKLPSDIHCMLPELCKEANKLMKRQNHLTTKRRRLLELALPKNRRCNYVPKCSCPFKTTLQIIHLDDQALHTRTEQLAFPVVRRLLKRKELAQERGDTLRLHVLNRVLRKSLLSMYSRLANIVPPQKAPKKEVMSKKEKIQHFKYVKTLAKHKELPEPPTEPRESKELKSLMRRIKKLAKPKQYIEFEKPLWELTPGMKTYQASPRMQDLSKPIMRDTTLIIQEINNIPPPNALIYKASKRIQELAQHTERSAAESDTKENPFMIAPNALKAKASARIKELAEPKEFENVHIRENPQLISPAALKAKASPRTIELAKPKGS